MLANLRVICACLGSTLYTTIAIRTIKSSTSLISKIDLGLLKHNSASHGYYLRAQNPFVQLTEVVQQFDLKSYAKPFSRCMECNGVLNGIAKQLALKHVDDDTALYFDEFFQCASCRKIYWKGLPGGYQKLIRQSPLPYWLFSRNIR